MFCKKCGKEQKNDAVFCTICGESLQAPQQQAPQQPAQPQQPAYQQPAQPQQPAYQQPQPPVYQQPAQQAQQPAYQQPQQQYGQYGAQPPPKKSKKPLFGIAGAAAAVLVFMLVIFPVIGGNNSNIIDPDESADMFNIDIGAEAPGGRDQPFEPAEGGFLTHDPGIAMIEINQCLSYGFDTNTAEFFPMDNFVAGKETAIFIDMAEPVSEKSEIKLKVERDGELVATLLPDEIVDENTIKFQPKDMSEVNNWAQGAYTFTVEIDDKYAERTTNFFDTMKIKILAVPVLANYSGIKLGCGDRWKNGAVMLEAVYPIARDNIEYVLGPEIDLSDDMYDLDTDKGMENTWRALTRLQTPDNEYTLILGFVARPQANNSCTGYTYGLPANIICESLPGAYKTVTHEIAHCYLIGDEYDGGRGSFNADLNVPPYGYKGRNIITGKTEYGENEKVRPGTEVGLNAEGSIIYPEQRAYWAGGRQYLGLTSSLMGSSTGIDSFEYWMTSEIWAHLFRVFTGQAPEYLPAEGDDGSPDDGYFGQCFNCYGDIYDPHFYINCSSCHEPVLLNGRINQDNSFDCESCGAVLNLEEFEDADLLVFCDSCQSLLPYPTFVEFNSGDGEMDRSAENRTEAVRITGFVTPDGEFLADPWYAFKAAPSDMVLKKDGEYAAYVLDSKGERKAVSNFDVVSRCQFETFGGVMFRDDVNIPVNVIVSLPDDAAKIVIQKGGRDVYVRDVSNNAPTVKFTGLSENQDLGNLATFTWEASDADGDGLVFELWYYPNEDEQYLVAADITGTSYEANLEKYPGTNSGHFTIIASDGVLTGQNDSPKVKVPYRAPDILNDIPDGTQFKVTDMFEIQGKVKDAQDGWLVDTGYNWVIDGEPWDDEYDIFYFFQFPYMLEPGMHTITLTATNSAGISATKDFNIEIVLDQSDLPEDWCRNDVTLALRLGYYLPLNMLESPVTRLEYAKMMFYVYSTVLPEDFVEIPGLEELIEFKDMSNDENDMDYLFAFVMVALGIMDAPGGEFDPYGSLTEREAMQYLYRAIELSKSQTVGTYGILDESEFIPKLTEWGLFDEDGSPNVYQADTKFTRKLAMVRIARFLKYELDLPDKDYSIEPVSLDMIVNSYEDFASSGLVKIQSN